MLSANLYLVIGSALMLCAIAVCAVSVNAILTERRRKALADTPPNGSAPRAYIEDNILLRFSRYLTPSKEAELSEMRLRMARAGYRRPSAVRIFHMLRAGAALGLTVLGAAAFPLLLPGSPLPMLFAVVVLAFLVGFLTPSLVLDNIISNRGKTAETGFPDTLDMLLVCVEAGQGFEQASRRIARELANHNRVLAEELGILNDELWAGKDRAAVFRDFALRLDVPDIVAFVGVLRQADQFGVSIAEAIRVYAADMRFKRVMRAEETANKMPLKLALASMAFTVPPTMIIMIGPAILEIVRSFTAGPPG